MNLMNLAFPVDSNDNIGGKSVDGFDTNTMETTGNLVSGLVVEFSAGMQNGINRFDGA